MNNAPFILINQEKCRGCRSCEVACAWRDSGPFNPRLAGINIMKLENEGIDYPVINTECQENFCGKVSPGRTREYEPACVTACLFGALEINPEVEYE